MMWVGGQSGTAIFNTTSSALTGGAERPPAKPTAATAASNKVREANLMPSSLLMPPTDYRRVAIFRSMAGRPPSADGRAGLPGKQVRMLDRDAHGKAVADGVARGRRLRQDHLEGLAGGDEVEHRDVAERLGQVDLRHEGRAGGRRLG